MNDSRCVDSKLEAATPAALFRRITGTRFPADAFPFLESTRFDARLVIEVLDGRRAGVIFRSVVSPTDCSQIVRNFSGHPGRYIRRSDAPAEYVGTFHFGKPLETYLESVAASDHELDRLFDGCCNPPAAFLTDLRVALASHGKGSLRLAEHDGRKAARFVMRSWTNKGRFSLQPHEDEAQCQAIAQRGFEIQEAAKHPLVAVNICVESAEGGSLRLWNIVPDDFSRDMLGLTETGSPYPLESLAGHQSQVVDIRPGDLYCFNGKAVHAVEPLVDTTRQRATIAFLMARLDSDTVVFWA